MKSRLNIKKYILLLIAFSSPPLLWWFLPNTIVDGTDIIFPLNPALNLQRSFFAWDTIYNTGSYLMASNFNSIKFPIYLYLTFLQSIGFSIYWVNKLWYFIYLFLPSLAMFLFIRELMKTSKNSNKIALIGAIFYVYNLYFVQQIIDQAITLSMIFTPLILYFFLKSISTRRYFFYSLCIALANFFYSPINPNSYLVGVIFIILFIAVFVVKEILSKKFESIVIVFKLCLLSLFFSVFVDAYWIIPSFLHLNQTISVVQSETADWLQGVSKYTSFFNVVRLIGAWDWFESWNKEAYAPYANLATKNVLFILISFISPLIAILGLFLSRNFWKYFFGVMAVLGIILAMGSHFPTGPIYTFLYQHLPLFWIFRSPWYKFSFFIVFSYAVLISFFADITLQKFNKNKVMFGLIILFLVTAYPLSTGSRFIQNKERHGNLAPLQVNIPSYVFKSSEWFNSTSGEERIMMVPQEAWESSEYQWGYGNLYPPNFTLLKKNPILILPYDRQGPGVDLIKNFKLALYSSTSSANYLAFLNAKYLVNQKDFSYFYFRAPENAKQVENLLESQKNLKKIEQFGQWDIYENSEVLPRIYATTNLVSINNIKDVAKLDLKQKPAFILDQQHTDFNKVSENLNVALNFVKVNPALYKINVNAISPYYLIFNEAFDKEWQIYEGENFLPVEHFLVNSYGNGFYINKTGNYQIQLKFKSQEIFNKSFLISIISESLLLILVAVLLVKQKMVKSAK